ncbi:GNAT family N-acetyltransferase [Ramlibacter humi]|uniref:GNAT family N-acetyltransferase n=1 Tax=Ramlibacter humi TaxID=2530451 RepID=UPI00197FD9FC|nr:GNAT family protein [Ramlibacter humi]
MRLEPLAQAHLPGLMQAIDNGALWSNPYTFVPQPQELDRFLDQAEAGAAAGTELAFAIVDSASAQVAGSTRYRHIAPHHGKLEIGYTFIARSFQRTYVNTEAKYLMLRFAFEEWQCERVEFQTDALNAQSRAAIERLGARQEGLLRRHYRMRDGRMRDTAIYSIVRDEWDDVRTALEDKLLAHEPAA